jgi:hypothetical protein
LGVQKVSAYDTPVYTDETCPHRRTREPRPPVVGREHEAQGRQRPSLRRSRARRVPDSLIDAEWIEAAQKRSLKRTRRPHLGIDVARYGDDESVIMQREGGWARIAWLGHKLSTMETTGHIIRIKNKLNAEPGLNDFVTIALDADGLGAGVYDRLIELGHPVGEIRGGMPSTEPDDYFNLRPESCWRLRERFERGDTDIDPNDKRAGQAS